MRNVSAKTHMSLCERKIWFGHAQESKHDVKCEMFAIIRIGERNWIPSDFFQKWGSLPRRRSRHAFLLNRSREETRYEPLRKSALEARNGVGSIEIIAPSHVTRARNFDEGAAQRINKQNGVGNYLHGR